MNDIRKALTENLNELIKTKNIRAIELAEKVGVSKSAVSHWLSGDNSPNIEILAKICQIYGVKLSEMLNEKIEISYVERKILEKYRTLDAYGQKAVSDLLNTEYDRCTENKIVEEIATSNGTADNQTSITSLVAARTSNDSIKPHQEKLPDLSQFKPDDSDL